MEDIRRRLPSLLRDIQRDTSEDHVSDVLTAISSLFTSDRDDSDMGMICRIYSDV